MTADQLLALLKHRGVTLSLRGDQLSVVADDEVLADQELIALLRSQVLSVSKIGRAHV